MCEEECRKILKEITGKDFISSYPKWLKNPKTGRQLQLDCYNEELKLAFEYDGLYHYQKGVFAPTSKILSQIQERDRIKDFLCHQNGVRMVRLPNILKKDIRPFLISSWNAFQFFSKIKPNQNLVRRSIKMTKLVPKNLNPIPPPPIPKRQPKIEDISKPLVIKNPNIILNIHFNPIQILKKKR